MKTGSSSPIPPTRACCAWTRLPSARRARWPGRPVLSTRATTAGRRQPETRCAGRMPSRFKATPRSSSTQATTASCCGTSRDERCAHDHSADRSTTWGADVRRTLEGARHRSGGRLPTAGAAPGARARRGGQRSQRRHDGHRRSLWPGAGARRVRAAPAHARPRRHPYRCTARAAARRAGGAAFDVLDRRQRAGAAGPRRGARLGHLPGVLRRDAGSFRAPLSLCVHRVHRLRPAPQCVRTRPLRPRAHDDGALPAVRGLRARVRRHRRPALPRPGNGLPRLRPARHAAPAGRQAL
mmetsp:Transcript_18221/g.43720  ORF Transcript_18221/g.43720 Transcript_18221/m.43720 type:complete len:296 (-) Transcript_18221:755-1642(-)